MNHQIIKLHRVEARVPVGLPAWAVSVVIAGNDVHVHVALEEVVSNHKSPNVTQAPETPPEGVPVPPPNLNRNKANAK